MVEECCVIEGWCKTHMANSMYSEERLLSEIKYSKMESKELAEICLKHISLYKKRKNRAKEMIKDISERVLSGYPITIKQKMILVQEVAKIEGSTRKGK